VVVEPATAKFAAIAAWPSAVTTQSAGRHAENVENVEAKDLPVAEQAMVCFLAFQNLTIYRILNFFLHHEAISHLNEIRMHSGSVQSPFQRLHFPEI
jgi:hypothetical protein